MGLGGLSSISRRGVRFFGLSVSSGSEVDDVVDAVIIDSRVIGGS
jgi:hypothetical protein